MPSHRNCPALIGGSADLDPSTHTALQEIAGDFESPAMAVGDLQGSAGGGWSLRRPQSAFRRARARDGGDLQRPGGAWRHRAVRRDLLDLFGLHAPADAARRLDGDCTVIYVFTHDSIAHGRGRPDASAGGAARQPARDSAAHRHPSRRRQRDRRGLACGHGDARAAGGAGADAARRADARPEAVCSAAKVCVAAPTFWPTRPMANRDLILIASGSEVAPDRAGATEITGDREFPCASFRCRAGNCSRPSLRSIATRCCRHRSGAGSRSRPGCRKVGIATSVSRGDVIGVDRFGASAPGRDRDARIRIHRRKRMQESRCPPGNFALIQWSSLRDR